MKNSLALFLLILLFLFSCRGEPPKETRKEKVLEVSTVPVLRERVSLVYETKGFFESPRDVILKPEVSGTVAELFVKEGSFVEAGEPLLKIDDRELRAQFRELKAKLEEVSLNYSYQLEVVRSRKELYQKELIAREEFRRELTRLKALKKQMDSLRASLKSVQVKLEKTLLRAPFSGFVAERFVSEGDLVGPQTSTFRLISLRPLYFTFRIPQEVSLYVKKGKEVVIEVPALGEYRGSIFFVSPYADETRQVKVKALVENEKGDLKAGMYGVVRLKTKEVQAFKVPERSVVLSGNRKVVWVVSNGRVESREVRILREEKGFLFVEGNLKEGERIVLDNAYALREGMRVKVR